MSKNRHIYILDTCVLIHDCKSITQFDDNDIYIPLSVIEELERQKTLNDGLGASARAVFREIKHFILDDLLNTGAVVNEYGGRLFVYNPIKSSDKITPIPRESADSAIIETCLQLKKQFPDRKVAVVTKDVALQIRCKTYGCLVEDYSTGIVEEEFYTGIREVEVTDANFWGMLWTLKDLLLTNPSIPDEVSEQLRKLSPNEFILFKYGDEKCPAMYKKGSIVFLKEKLKDANNTCFGITGKNLEQKFALIALTDPDISLVMLNGAAGTGKTIAALASALEGIENNIYNKIIVIKPIIPVSGRDIGALPGSKWEKLAEWLGPLRDNYEQIIEKRLEKSDFRDSKLIRESLEEMISNEIIEAEAMTYIQGRSIPKSIIFVDEAQNLRPHEARMVVERAADGSKVIFCGDMSQIESPYLDARSCGLAQAICGSRGVDGCATVTLRKVERSKLASIASLIFKHQENKQ